MSNFEQKESITRRLTRVIIIISLFFILGSGTFYISSQSTLKGLTRLHSINQIYDIARQTNQIVLSLSEVLRKTESPDSRALNLFRMSEEQANLLFQRAIALGVEEVEAKRQLAEAHEAVLSFNEACERLLSNTKEFSKNKLVVTQLEVETLDQLARLQIILKANSDQVFSKIYEDRFNPLLITAAFALMFTCFSLFIGFGLRKRLNKSIGNLVEATQYVARGDLTYQAPIFQKDEIGLVTDAFNKMLDNLRSRIVSIDDLENIIESMVDFVVVLDADGNILQMNHAGKDTFGFSKEELRGRQYNVLFTQDLPLQEMTYDQGVFATTKEGRQIPVSVTISSLGATGHRKGFVCVIRDITEKIEAERKLKAHNLALVSANKELEAFSYSVSHDLRAPLRGIDGFSQALYEELGPSLNSEMKDYLQRIRTGVQKMGHLIDDMLELSKLTRKEMKIQKVDMQKVALDILKELQQNEPQRQVEYVVKGDLEVNADAALMGILLQNLLGNAWKYTSKIPLAKIDFYVEEQNGQRVFVVRDNGAGFDMTYYEKLFGAFQRLHRDSEFPGTGVGLATVQRIIHRHGGRVWAQSEVNKGSSFYFILPS